jgi:hypothetical protein
MHDLNTIARLNQAAIENAVTPLQQAGNFVLVKYAGLSVLSITTFPADQRKQACDELALQIKGCGASERVVLHAPTPAASSVQTLGDYIAAKTQPLTTGFAPQAADIVTQAC